MVPASVFVSANGGAEYVRSRPSVSTMPGMAKGSTEMNSSTGFNLGSRRCTQYVVGTMTSVLNAMVSTPASTENASDE